MKTLKASRQAKILFLVVATSLLSRPSIAQDATLNGAEIGFDALWERVLSNSPNLLAYKHDLKASTIAQERAERHWYPNLYANARVFTSDDPAANFVNSLQQRQVESSDFSPSSLNHPGSHFFRTAEIGVNLPLYEGGSRSAQAKAAQKTAQARSWELRAQEVSSFAQAAENYAALLTLTEEKSQLVSLKDNLSVVLNQYSIGAKSNPVGYSGLLGLKNLRNRVDGLLLENEMQANSYKAALNSLATNLPEAWRPRIERATVFLGRVFAKTSEISRAENLPATVMAAKLSADAFSELKTVERARYLPRLGLFAQSEFFSGSRSSATSYATGAYLQWDLFSAQNIGSVEQAAHQVSAAEFRARAAQARLADGRSAAIANSLAVEKSLQLLDESSSLLEEQTKTARTLFHNGSINALQLVEVLNRRADLLKERSGVEIALAKIKAAIHVSNSHEGVSK